MKTEQYFSYSPDGGFDFHDTEQEAITAATKQLDYEKDHAGSEGWSEEVDSICWGEIRQRVELTWHAKRPAPEDLDEECCDKEGTYWGTWDGMEKHELMPLLEKPTQEKGGAE